MKTKILKGKYIVVAIFTCLIILTILAGCEIQTATITPTPTTLSSGPQYGGTLKIIMGSLSTLDHPAEITSTQQFVYSLPAFDTLWHLDKLGNPTPFMAEAVNVSPDGKTIAVTLRKGTRFHDGTNLTADAVKYQLNNMKVGAPIFKNITSVDIIDDYNFRLNFSKYDPSFINMFVLAYGMIGSPTAAQKPATSNKMDRFIGAGAFKIADWKQSVSIKYVKNNDYWDKKKPYLDALEITAIADSVTAGLAFENGDAQLLWDVTPKQGRELAGKNFNVISYDSTSAFLVSDGSNADSPFADSKVRQALEYSIDKKAIADALGYGFYKPLTQICPPASMGYNSNLQSRQYDTAKAKQLMSESKYPNGFKTRIIAQTTDDQNVLVAIQNYLKAIGIDAPIEVSEKLKYYDISKNGWNNGLMFFASGVDSNYAISLGMFFGINGIYDRSMIRPAGFQPLIDQALAEANADKRQNLVQQAVKMMYDESMVVPLYTKPQIRAMQKSVHDTGIFEISHLWWNPCNIWLSK